MKTLSSSLLLVSLAAVGLSTARAKIDRTVEKTFTVQPGGTLNVGTSGGNITVEVASGDTVKVTATEHIRASSEADADEILKKLDLTIEQKGADVTATAEYEQGTMGFHFGSWPPVQVDFVVSVPAKYSAELKTSGGAIVVGDLGGTLVAHTSGGGVRLGKISGRIDASTSGGNMALVSGGDDVRLSTSGGNLTLGSIAGSGDVHTSGGDISISAIGGPLNARTSGGNIKAAFTGPLKGDCSLSTSGGRVVVSVPAGANFNLDASTSGGEVRADGVTITVAHGGLRKSHLAGTVGTGGPQLRMRSSGGNVILETGTLASR